MSKDTERHVKSSPSQSDENIRSDFERKMDTPSIISTPSIGKLKVNQSVPYTTKIVGVLQELKEDVRECSPDNMAGDYIYYTSTSGVVPKTGLTEVYVEHNGRFIKASKDISNQNLDSGLRYFQPIDSEDIYNTPLDMAIYVQKIWNVMSKILFGILAGLATFDLIILDFHLDITKNWEIIENFLNMYSPISFLITKCYHIILTICLITLFDWFDLAHMNLQHLVDTINFRKIWIVTIIYFVAFVVTLYNFSSDDMIILYDRIKDYVKTKENLDHILYFWMVARKICCWCCIIGWIFITTANNEDLFLIHLTAMKKYDYEENVNQIYENVNAIP